jgi:nicotinate-nucleotide pyrophosphorylase (carboxylating)
MPTKFDWRSIRPFLREALKEDGAWNDRTSKAVISAKAKARGEVLAKGNGVLAGLPLLVQVYSLLDPRCRVKVLQKEGTKVRKGMQVALLEGPAQALLSGERVSLNLLSRLSGIATLTRQFRDKLKKNKLFDTRKTTPLLRPLERYAVRVGGGNNHRYNLSGHVLIKDNHRRLGGGVFGSVSAARLKYGAKEFIEVEVETYDQAEEALRAGADIILVDNASPKDFARILKLVKGKMQVETSGGLTLSNIGAYSKLKVDRFSSGALTHSATAVDFSIEFYPVG